MTDIIMMGTQQIKPFTYPLNYPNIIKVYVLFKIAVGYYPEKN